MIDLELREHKMLVLSNVNLDLVNKELMKTLKVHQTDGYGQWVQYALDTRKTTDLDLDSVFVILDGNELVRYDSEIQNIEYDNIFNYLQLIVKNNPTLPIYISNIDLYPRHISSGDSEPIERTLMQEWDDRLKNLLVGYNNAHLFDLRLVIEQYGRDFFYSSKMWYMASCPYNMKAINTLGQAIIKKVRQQLAIRKKVLVLDLDNTLWGGVVGEDGLEGIQLAESSVGAIYKDIQRRIKELKDLGALLTIASKNNEADVLKVLENHPHMILREDDFVAISANWNPKATNIMDMAQKLNLGLDSFVFLDDNPVERESVKLTIPQVTVVDFPNDIANLPNTINQIADEYFYIHRLTKEDADKTDQYKQEAERQRILDSASSIEEFLQTLEIRIVLEKMKESQINRVAQLTQKTNQFNLMTARYSVEQLQEYVNDKSNQVYVASASDRFGDSGLILVLMISIGGKIARIDNFLMSCRVMGRYIEDAVIDSVEKRLIEAGVDKIEVVYKKTEKNEPVRELMERLDYQCTYSDNVKKNYYRELDDTIKSRKLLFTPEWRE